MDDLQEDPARDTGKYYVSKNASTGAMFGKVNIKDKIAQRLGWKTGLQVTIEIKEIEGKRGLWIEPF